MTARVLVSISGRKIQKTPHRLKAGNQQLDVVAFEIVDKVADAGQGPFCLDDFELGELTDVLEVTATLVIDHKVSINVFS